MKLHLPKLLLTAVLAAEGITQTAWAETYNLLESSVGWTLTNTNYDAEAGSISASNWNGNKYATYVAGMDKYFVVDENNSLTFSLSYTIGGNNEVTWNSVQTFAFVSVDNAIVFGTETFGQANVGTTHIGYGTTENVTASHYGVTSSTPAVTLTPYEGAVRTNPGTYTINGTVTYADGSYSLTSTLSDGTNTYSSTTIDLGDRFEIGRFVFTSEGHNRSLTELSITGNLVCRRYETTVSGNLDVKNATWSNDGNNVTTADINLSDNTAILGLTGSGDAATITFESGTNVAEIEVKGGNITLLGENGLHAGILEVLAGASATIGSNMTVSSFVFNDGSIVEIADNTVVSYTGSQVSMAGLKGTGTIEINKDAQIGAQNGETTSSDFGGIIVVKEGTLTLGSTGTQNHGHNFDLSEATIELAGGNAHYFGNRGELGTLKVSANAELGIFEMKGSDPRFTVETVDIAAGKTLTINRGKVGGGDWNLRMEVGCLIGEGNLILSAGNKEGRIFTFDSVGTETTAFGNITNNQTLNLGAGASSILNMRDVNNTGGILNIKGNLAGTSTISGGTINIKEGASVSGDITFGSVVNVEAAMTNSGTLTFSEAVALSNGITNIGTLNFSNGYSSVGTLTNEGIFNLTGNVSISDIGKLEDSGVVTYSHNDGKDGYITGATYFVVESTGEGAYATVTGDSKLMLGSAEIGSITSSGNNLVVDIHNENANSGIYYINTQDLTVDGTETNVAVNATGYVIAKDRTLTLRKDQKTTTMTASKILAEATGEGNITVDVDFTYQGQSKAKGTLTINQGKTLKVGKGSNDTSNISSFNAVVLKGATLDLNGSAQEVQNLMVDTAKSTLSMRNQNKGHQIYTLSGTTTLKADLDVIPMDKEHGDLVVKNLTGIGNLHASGGNATWGPVVLKLEKLTDYTGTVSVDSLGRTSDINFVEFGKSDTDAAFSTLKGLSLSNNAYATIHAKGDSTIENLTLTNGAKLNYTTNYSANKYTLSNVVVSGEGNSINLAATNTYHQGCLEIDNLTNARTEDGETIAGAITISGNARTSARDVVNLNGGDFVGTITYKGATNDGTKRKHALNIKSATAAANAVINLEALSDGDVVALGLGDDTVNVKGITGSNATIYSGEQEYGNSNAFASDTQKSRTLAINTAGVSYENSVAVAANVNLEKRGAGKQTFSGDMSAFNGSLKVIEGELAFTAAEALKVNGLYVGPEKNTAAPAASEGANVGILTVANGIEASGAVTLVGGAVINGNLDLNTATDVSFDVASGAIALNGALTMSSTEAFVTALGDSLAGLTAGEMLTVFTGLASFTIGDVTSADFTSADLITWSSSDAVAAGQYTVEYQVNNNVGSIVIINRMDAVPEPASATLSLAALMMLCARRRRRK